MRIISFIEDVGLPGGLLRDYNTTRVAPMVSISAINVLLSDYPKRLDLIFIYLLGLMISSGNLRFQKYASIEGR